MTAFCNLRTSPEIYVNCIGKRHYKTDRVVHLSAISHSRTAGGDDILRLAEIEALDALVDAEHGLVHVGSRARHRPRRLLLRSTAV